MVAIFYIFNQNDWQVCELLRKLYTNLKIVYIFYIELSWIGDVKIATFCVEIFISLKQRPSLPANIHKNALESFHLGIHKHVDYKKEIAMNALLQVDSMTAYYFNKITQNQSQTIDVCSKGSWLWMKLMTEVMLLSFVVCWKQTKKKSNFLNLTTKSRSYAQFSQVQNQNERFWQHVQWK